ncbi:hypothetical protein CYMTET_32368 [Cymbomonas tetramitiformis]|uniref:Uncharacterized protein n=1 Tax=Cymbomonas tetramitiformis TaxID=36881 RepID=A0AAE0KRZ7_9CHLO|nr:hypothetical protein CYMTET_32368 [Cymbomonas tetramitiformis]
MLGTASESTPDYSCRCGRMDKSGQPINCRHEHPDHDPGQCKRKRIPGELRCYRCANRRHRPKAKLDAFDREASIGFAAPYTVTLPQETSKHLGERFARMWTDALAKVNDPKKLEGAVPLTGGKLEVFHSSAGSGNAKIKSTFYDTILADEDQRHLDIFVEHVRTQTLKGLSGDYTFENAAFLIKMDLQIQVKKKLHTLSTVTGWQPWHLDQPLNRPLRAPAHHLAVVAYLGPSSPTRICTAPHVSVEEMSQRLGASILEASTPANLVCDRDFSEQCPLLLPKKDLDAAAANVGGKPRVHLGERALVGGVHQGVANTDRTPRVVFSANLALRSVASYNPDVQNNPVNTALYWGFWDFGVKEYVKYLQADTDLAATCADDHKNILKALAADVQKGFKRAVESAAKLGK